MYTYDKLVNNNSNKKNINNNINNNIKINSTSPLELKVLKCYNQEVGK